MPSVLKNCQFVSFVVLQCSEMVSSHATRPHEVRSAARPHSAANVRRSNPDITMRQMATSEGP